MLNNKSPRRSTTPHKAKVENFNFTVEVKNRFEILQCTDANECDSFPVEDSIPCDNTENNEHEILGDVKIVNAFGRITFVAMQETEQKTSNFCELIKKESLTRAVGVTTPMKHKYTNEKSPSKVKNTKVQRSMCDLDVLVSNVESDVEIATSP